MAVVMHDGFKMTKNDAKFKPNVKVGSTIYRLPPPYEPPKSRPLRILLKSGLLEVSATVTIGGDRDGYELGFTQLSVTTEKTLYYRRLDPSHGSMLLRWPQERCVDIDSVNTWPFGHGPKDAKLFRRGIGDPDYHFRHPTRIDLAKIPVGKKSWICRLRTVRLRMLHLRRGMSQP